MFCPHLQVSNDFRDPNVPAEAPFPPISVRIRLQKPTDVKRFLSQDGYAEPESGKRLSVSGQFEINKA